MVASSEPTHQRLLRYSITCLHRFPIIVWLSAKPHLPGNATPTLPPPDVLLVLLPCYRFSYNRFDISIFYALLLLPASSFRQKALTSSTGSKTCSNGWPQTQKKNSKNPAPRHVSRGNSFAPRTKLGWVRQLCAHFSGISRCDLFVSWVAPPSTESSGADDLKKSSNNLVS